VTEKTTKLIETADKMVWSDGRYEGLGRDQERRTTEKALLEREKLLTVKLYDGGIW
jgi:hypothetical protein